MLIVANMLIVLFILAMAAIWATYGLFSSFLHLVIVIVSGVVAFAIWEPLAFVLLGRMPEYAWGVALLAPFGLTLIIVRALMDKYCKMNLKFPRLADQIGGAAFGVVSGVLSIGFFVIGLGFMNAPPDLMGLKPYRMSSNKVEENDEGGKLWVPVHAITGGFYTMLSTGAMAPTLSDNSLAVNKSDVAERAFTYRLQNDENQMKSAHPDTIQVVDAYTVSSNVEVFQHHMKLDIVRQMLNPEYALPDIPEGTDPQAVADAIVVEAVRRLDADDPEQKPSDMLNTMVIRDIANKLDIKNPTADFESFVKRVVTERTTSLLLGMQPTVTGDQTVLIVDTLWKKEPAGTFNTDGWLRVAIPQIRLQVLNSRDEYELIPPIAYSLEVNKLTGQRVLVSLTSQQVYAAYTQDDDVKIGWFFKLPAGATATRLEVRQLGFDLSSITAPNTQTLALAQALGAGEIPPKEEEDPRGGPVEIAGVGIGASGARAELTERLPKALSPNSATQVTPDKSNPERWTAFEGYQLLSSGAGIGGGRASRMQSISVPANSRLLRVELDPNSARSLYGQALERAKNLQVMQVRDTTGNSADAIAFVLLRDDGSQIVAIREDSRGEITSLRASDLPSPARGDKLYVYFQVTVGRTLTSFMLGGQPQDFETPIEVVDRGRR
ncbi:MAG: CvpA family protein [Planctomycetota bacterium]